MANIKSQIKRNITNEKKREANASFKSSLKTAIKNVEAAAEANNKEVAITALNLAFQKLDKSITNGVHHKNYVANQKSRLSLKVNKIN